MAGLRMSVVVGATAFLLGMFLFLAMFLTLTGGRDMSISRSAIYALDSRFPHAMEVSRNTDRRKIVDCRDVLLNSDPTTAHIALRVRLGSPARRDNPSMELGRRQSWEFHV